METDLAIALRFWGTLFFVGAAAFPITRLLFTSWPASNAPARNASRTEAGGSRSDAGWWDEGYLFAKAVGMALATYIVYILARFHIAPFTFPTVVGSLGLIFIVGLLATLIKQKGKFVLKQQSTDTFRWWRVLIVELVFLAAFLFWAWIKAHEPSIRGLEKFMDYGFTQTILNSNYFPAADMWFAGLPINYYYFGHTVMALLTRLSGLDLSFTYNLTLSALFALCLTMSFSIGFELAKRFFSSQEKAGRVPVFVVGLFASILVTLAGNMQTVYAFTQGYSGEDVRPFWELLWPAADFITNAPVGMQRYWYANATRFIPFTIHEFPSYSFVVSDVHGHVLSIPFALLAIALLIMIFVINGRINDWVRFVFYGLLCGILLMTNALDGPIYVALFILILWFVSHQPIGQKASIALTVIAAALISALPFLSHFKSFVAGIAVNCPPAIVSNTKIGPLLFEAVEKCQHSPFWMLYLLWGFFWFCGGWLVVNLLRARKKTEMKGSSKVFIIFFIFSTVLILFSELFYFKDIYPAHFRSNTMFKLGYQAFMMLGIVSAVSIVWTVWFEKVLWKKFLFIGLLLPQLVLVLIYPYFSVPSYFGGLREYHGIYGLEWMARELPDDLAVVRWLQQEETRKPVEHLPVILEADGESYTNASRISAFAGLPTVVGWAVHEWLWRGTYDVVVPRRDEVRAMYESTDRAMTAYLLGKYNVKYIIVGDAERTQYPNLNEETIVSLGEEAYRTGNAVVYRVILH